MEMKQQGKLINLSELRKKYNLPENKKEEKPERKKWWWELDDSSESEDAVVQDSEIQEYYGYDYGFTSLGQNKSLALSPWDEYEKTGIWKNYDYYRPQNVDYKYIEQMANAFASKYNIDVVIGREWSVDIAKKTLTYDPMDLLKFNKAQVIALLLHEIGHIRHTSVVKSTDSKFFDKYRNSAMEVINFFEDFRIDEIMSKAYEGAKDVYKENVPIIEEIAKQYRLRSDGYKARLYDDIYFMVMRKVDYKSDHNQIFKDGVDKIEIKLKKAKEMINSQETLFDYLQAMLLIGNNLKIDIKNKKIKAYIDKTKNAIKTIKNQKDFYSLLKTLDEKVFPVIEELLKNKTKPTDELSKMLGEDGKGLRTNLEMIFVNLGRGDNSTKGIVDSRVNATGNLAGRDNLPKEWLNGEYKPLKDSVLSSIRELIKKLTFLRRKELIVKYHDNERRGRLNIKSIFKHRLGNLRLFKKKIETTDTIRSFAFSIVLDISGSMGGEKIVQSVRGLIILLEVFEKMKIPYDVTAFKSNSYKIKNFTDSVCSQKQKNKIAGFIKNYGGGTYLTNVFLDGIDLDKRPERNKIFVLISDGETEDYQTLHRRFMDKLVKQGVKFLGVSLCYKPDKISKLCYGNAIDVQVSSKLPEDFANLLKSLILQKKGLNPYQNINSGPKDAIKTNQGL